MRALLIDALRYVWRAGIVRFAAVGAFCMCMHFGLFALLFEWFSVHYQFSNVFGFLVAFGFNFGLNKLFTFESPSLARVRSELPRFVAKKIGFYALGAACLHILVEMAGMHPSYAQLVLIPTLGVAGYFVLRRFVF